MDLQLQNILAIISKTYEQRSKAQKISFVNFLSNYYIEEPLYRLKLIAFYAKKIQGPRQIKASNHNQHRQGYCPFSHILILPSSHSTNYMYQKIILSGTKSVSLKQNQVALIVDYQDYLSIEALGQTSIEQQLAFISTSQYLCCVPKNVRLNILRNCSIQNFKENQNVYFQGQDITPYESGSGIFFVRSGEFVYEKYIEKENKNREVFTFKKGNIFGHIDLQDNESCDGRYSKRLFTAKCKSIKSIVYKFERQFFDSKIKNYCQSLLVKRQSKLMKYLPSLKDTKNSLISVQKLNNMNTTSNNKINQQGNSVYLQSIQKLKPNNTKTSSFMSTYNNKTQRILWSSLDKNMTKNSFNKVFPNLVLPNPTRYSQTLAQKLMRNTNYLSLKRQGPLKNYPMAKSSSKYTDSEFRFLDFVNPQRPKVTQLKPKGKVGRADYIFRLLSNNQICNKYKPLSKQENDFDYPC